MIPLKKLTNGFQMPIYGFGTWLIGGTKERDLQNDDAADISAMKAALGLGVTHFDTAEVYAEGYAEELLGKAISDYDRSKLFLVSKAKGKCETYDDVIQSCKSSLARINTPYLDLYLLHKYTPQLHLEEAMAALDTLIDEGLIKNIGVSNFSKERLEEAQSYAKNKIVCNQVQYNLKDREPEKNDLVTYCQNNDILIVAYRPIDKGRFVENTPSILRGMCEKYNKTPSQIAINWLISQDNIIVISKTRNLAHLQENLGALGWNLSETDIELLRNEYPDQESVSSITPLG